MKLGDFVPNLPQGAPDLGDVLLDTGDVPWREKSLPGLHEKMLWRDRGSGATIALVKFEKGVGIPDAHSHASNQFMYVLSGRYEYTATGTVLTAGSFYWNPKGNVHGPTMAHEETVFVEIYDGPHYPERPSWYTDDADIK